MKNTTQLFPLEAKGLSFNTSICQSLVMACGEETFPYLGSSVWSSNQINMKQIKKK